MKSETEHRILSSSLLDKGNFFQAFVIIRQKETQHSRRYIRNKLEIKKRKRPEALGKI